MWLIEPAANDTAIVVVRLLTLLVVALIAQLAKLPRCTQAVAKSPLPVPQAASSPPASCAPCCAQAPSRAAARL